MLQRSTAPTLATLKRRERRAPVHGPNVHPILEVVPPRINPPADVRRIKVSGKGAAFYAGGRRAAKVAEVKNDLSAPRGYTRDEISGWIRRYRASGLALGSFAEQHGLSRNQLHYWVYDRRFARPRPPVMLAPVFQELKVTADLPPQNWAAEISLRARARVCARRN